MYIGYVSTHKYGPVEKLDSSRSKLHALLSINTRVYVFMSRTSKCTVKGLANYFYVP